MSKDIEVFSERTGVRVQVSETQTAVLRIPHPCNESSPFNGLMLVLSSITSSWNTNSCSFEEDFYEKAMEWGLKWGI